MGTVPTPWKLFLIICVFAFGSVALYQMGLFNLNSFNLNNNVVSKEAQEEKDPDLEVIYFELTEGCHETGVVCPPYLHLIILKSGEKCYLLQEMLNGSWAVSSMSLKSCSPPPKTDTRSLETSPSGGWFFS